MTKKAFCAHCQARTDQSVMVHTNNDGHDEFVFTCSVCNRQIKFPATNDPQQIQAMLAAHEESNIGQVQATEPPDPLEHPAMKALAVL